MPTLIEELKAEIANHVDYRDLTDEQWDVKTTYRGLHKRSQKDFDWLEGLYPKKISDLRDRLAGDWDFSVNISRDGKELNSPAEILDAVNAKMDEWYYCQEKERRLLDKLACVIEEQRLRRDGFVVRTGTHEFEYYYVDYGRSDDTADGRRFPTNIGDSGANATIDSVSTTDLTDAALSGETIVAGDYVYNVTRSDSTTVSSFAGTTITCAKDIGAAGWTGTDEYYLIRSWKRITKYTVTEIRVPGDRAFLRANITWLQGTEAVDINFDEDGSIDSRIELIGADSVTNDPWSDSSDVKPIIDFEDAAYQFRFNNDHFWKLTRLDIANGNDSDGLVINTSSDYNVFVDCDFHDTFASIVEGVRIVSTDMVSFTGCTWQDCLGVALHLASSSKANLTNCTFTVGISADYGIRLLNSSIIHATDTTFSGSWDIVVIKLEDISTMWMRNTAWGGATPTLIENSIIYSEDDAGTFESQITTFEHGTITRGTTSPRAGGASSFAIMESNSACGTNRPLRLGDRLAGFARVWKAAGSYTATVYARVDSAWDSALTAAECYMVTSELDNAGDASRVERQSTETINNATSWTAFTTAVTPAREGWIYFWFYLAKFEDATEKVHVDIKVDVS